MKLTTVAAAAAFFSEASALYLPIDYARNYPQYLDNGYYYIKDSDPRSHPAGLVEMGFMETSQPRPTKVSTPKLEKLSPETKMFPGHITPPEDKKDKAVPYVEGGASEESDRGVHYSHIQIHKTVPRSLKKRQKGPDPAKVDVDEPENALTPLIGPILEEVGQRHKPLIPKKLGVKETETTVTHVEKNGRVIIYPKSKPKQRNHAFLEGLIGKIGQSNKGSDASEAKSHGKETTNQKDCDKEKNDELLGNVIDKVERRVKPQTPTFSKDKYKATVDPGEKLIDDLIRNAEKRARPQIPTKQGQVADDDEVLEDLLEQAKLQHKTLEPRWSARLRQKPSPLEKKIRKKQGKPMFSGHKWSLFGNSKYEPESYPALFSLRGYSPEYLSGLLTLEFDEMCRKNPKNCIKPKHGGPRVFTPFTLEARARLEDMKNYAMAHMSPDDFKSQRYLMDKKADKIPEIEFWVTKDEVLYRPKMDYDDPAAREEHEAFEQRKKVLGSDKKYGWSKPVPDEPTNWPGILFKATWA